MGIVNRILLVCDGCTSNATVVKRVSGLTAGTGARVTALTIVPSLPADLCRVSLPFDPEDLWDLALEERTRNLQKWVQPLIEAGCSPELRVRRGSFFRTIVDEVAKEGHDLLVLSDNGIRRWNIFGRSASVRLLERCSCSTWLVQSGGGEMPEHVAVFVSWPMVSAADCALAEKLVHLAIAAAPGARTFRMVLASQPPCANPRREPADLLGVSWLSGAVAELANRGIPAEVEPAGEGRDALDRLLHSETADLLVMPASMLQRTRVAAGLARAGRRCSILAAVPDQQFEVRSPGTCGSAGLAA